MSEIKIVDGSNHLDEVKQLVIEYTNFLVHEIGDENSAQGRGWSEVYHYVGN